MNARWKTICAGLSGLVLLGLIGLFPAPARAQCCAPPPPCNCKPPKPPPPPADACCNGGHQVRVPGVNVVVGASVVVNASAMANASASASGRGNVTVFSGGGGSSFAIGGGSVSVIQGLNVEGGGSRLQRSAYSATRTKVKTVVIQAFCLDDRDIPHPASQVGPDRDIPESYDGEIYRCLAGTRMQITFADYEGRIAFDKGQTMMCAKGEALYYSGSGSDAAGRMECRPQKPARDCNERSLLRRFGAGVKILRIITTETYTAYREETVQTSQVSTFNMSVDGGVGGIAY